MLAPLVYHGLRAFGIPALVRRLRDAGVILCYHNVVATTSASRTGESSLHLPLDAFVRQMQWLVSHYTVVSLGDFVARLEERRPLRRLAAITFDDAYTGVFQHAWPVLLQLRIPATVFVIASAPAGGAPFWWDHPSVKDLITPQRRRAWLHELRGDGPAILRSLPSFAESQAVLPWQAPADWHTIAQAGRAGLTLGVHSLTHRALPTLGDAELRAELVTAREVIEHQAATSPEFFAYPYGVWDVRVRDAVCSAGYRAAVTLDYGLNGERDDPWTLQRVNVPAGISDAAFQAWMAGLWPRRSRV